MLPRHLAKVLAKRISFFVSETDELADKFLHEIIINETFLDLSDMNISSKKIIAHLEEDMILKHHIFFIPVNKIIAFKVF